MGSGRVGIDLDRDSFDYCQACLLKGPELVWVVRDDLHLAKPEVKEDLGTLLVCTGIDGKSEFFVGFDSVGSFVLKGICPDLVDDPDAPALLLLINDRTASFRLDHFHRLVELRAAVAFDRAEDI